MYVYIHIYMYTHKRVWGNLFIVLEYRREKFFTGLLCPSRCHNSEKQAKPGNTDVCVVNSHGTLGWSSSLESILSPGVGAFDWVVSSSGRPCRVLIPRVPGPFGGLEGFAELCHLGSPPTTGLACGPIKGTWWVSDAPVPRKIPMNREPAGAKDGRDRTQTFAKDTGAPSFYGSFSECSSSARAFQSWLCLPLSPRELFLRSCD